MTTPKTRGRPPKQAATPTPAPRAPGRPKGNGRKTHLLAIRLDTDIYETIKAMGDHTGIPTSRIANAILRAYVDAKNVTIELGIVEAVGTVRIPNRWPGERTTEEIRAQYPKEVTE